MYMPCPLEEEQMIDSGLVGGVPREQKMLKGHLPRAIYQQAYTSIGPFLGPLGFDFAQHRQTLRPSVVGIRSKALRPFGLQ